MVELDINGEPEVAWRCMELARKAHEPMSWDIAFIMLMVRILMRLKDIKQIRWLFQSLLGDEISAIAKTGGVDVSGIKESIATIRSPASRAVLWEEYFKTELSMGLCSLVRLNDLRDNALRARALVPQTPTPTTTLSSIVSQIANLNNTACGFFEYPLELLEKYSMPSLTIPDLDVGLKDRCRGSAYIDDLARAADLEQAALDSQHGKKKWGRNSKDAALSDDVLLAGLPAFFKELLTKLPPLNGPMPDVDFFVDTLRRTVLPPRPSEDIAAGKWQSIVGEESGKRGRPGNTNIEGGIADDGAIISAGTDTALIEGEMDVIEDYSNKNDIFRKRQRLRLANEGL